MFVISALSLLLSIFPIPLGMEWLRLDWLLLTLLFWNFFFPHRTGILSSFGWGLAKDVLTGGFLGQTALSFAVISYLAIKLSQRISIFPLAQQAISVGLLMGLYQLIMLWIGALMDKTPSQFGLYWIPSLLSVVLWPWMYAIVWVAVRRFKLQ